MSVTPASIVALASVGVLGVASAVAWKTGPHQWWKDGPPPVVRPLALLFFGFSFAALGLTVGLGNDGDIDVYHSLVASYYLSMVAYLFLMVRRAYRVVVPTLWVAAAVQLVAAAFLMTAATSQNRNEVSIASVLQVFAAVWATLYDGIIYPARDMPSGHSEVAYSSLGETRF